MTQRCRMLWLIVIAVAYILILNGCGVDSATTTGNNVPVANAGTDQNISVGTLVTLDANASSDADGDALSYIWSFTSIPNDSEATLSDTSSINPTFTTDVEGAYTLQLLVNDGIDNSQPDFIIVTASTGTGNNVPGANLITTIYPNYVDVTTHPDYELHQNGGIDILDNSLYILCGIYQITKYDIALESFESGYPINLPIVSEPSYDSLDVDSDGTYWIGETDNGKVVHYDTSFNVLN